MYVIAFPVAWDVETDIVIPELGLLGGCVPIRDQYVFFKLVITVCLFVCFLRRVLFDLVLFRDLWS